MRRALDWTVAFLVLARCAWIFGALVRSPDVPLRLAQDDFYYYLRTAQNLAWHHHSVFFAQVPTNGYHPLYFLLLTVLSLFVRTLPGIFRCLWLLDVLSAMAIFLLTRRLFAKVTSPLMASGLAVLITSLSVTQICDQMEVTLALPLGFAFLLAGFVEPEKLTVRRAVLAGLLGALTFLARLDAGLLVVFYALATLATGRARGALSQPVVTGFLAAVLPLPLLYVWSNHHFFGTFLPISGMAKELRHGWRPSLLLPASFSGTSELLVNAALLTAVLAWALRRDLSTREKVLFSTVLTTPLVFYGLEMVLSDWPVWDWYFYLLRFSAAGLALLIAVVASRDIIPLRYPRLRRMAHGQGLAALVCVAALLKLAAAHYKVDVVMVDIQQATGELNGFAQMHPGIYAMGDRAGMFAMISAQPVLQAEGLMMDRRYLEHIRAQDDLRSVLRQYGVNYYVAFVFARNAATQLSDSCFHAVEPSLAGPSALHMRSDFCEAPVASHDAEDGRYLIYRMQPEAAPSE